MTTGLEFAQLWAEEEQYLAELSSSFVGGALAVEIGTAQGGSAYLLSINAINADLLIHSYDIEPSIEAYENLKGLNVVIHRKSSADGAAEWEETCGKDLDLLLVDGSHTLENVYADFQAWSRMVKRGGRVVFHDFDPIHRGGFPHLGVFVFIEGLKRQNALDEIDHIGRYFTGIMNESCDFLKLIENCGTVLNNWRKSISICLDPDYGKVGLVASDSQHAEFLNSLPEFEVVVARDLADIHRDSFVSGSQFFYLFQSLLANERDRILSLVRDRASFFRWNEVLEMFEHNSGQFTDAATDDTASIRLLSQMCAVELVRMNIIRQIFSSLET